MRLRDHVVGHDWDFAAAPRRVDHERGDAEPGGVPPQAFDDLNPLGDGGSEVLQADAQVALIQIVRPHPHFDQLVHQPAHHVHAIVHPPQQNCLIAQGDPRVRQPLARQF